MKNFKEVGIFTKAIKKNMEFIKKLEYTLSLTSETLPILNGKNGKGWLVTCGYFGDFASVTDASVLLIKYMKKLFEIDVVDVYLGSLNDCVHYEGQELVK